MALIRGRATWSTTIAPIVFVTLIAVTLIAALPAAASAADTITGVVRNQTLGLPAGGDEVILLRVDQGMDVESRTQTDPQGGFTFTVRETEKLHLVRVVHRGINYDQRISAGNAVSVDVFDSATEVQGVTGNIEIMRIGTNGKFLHVSDMVEIKNDSRPPLTKSSNRTLEIYLPAQAKMDSVLGAGSDKIGVMISATPIPGEPGHYAVNFPLRPGTTKFAFNYDLPYNGHATFHTRSMLPLHQLAVMIPPTMKFTSRSLLFQQLATNDDRYRVEAANELRAGNGPGFEISGAGTLPALAARAAKPQVIAPSGLAPARSETSSVQVHQPISSDARPHSESFSDSSLPLLWLLRLRWFGVGAGSVLLPGAFAYLLRRKLKRPRSATMAAGMQRTAPAPGIETLKDEMFQLEVDRLRGAITLEQYTQGQRGLETTFTQALVGRSQSELPGAMVPPMETKPPTFVRPA